MSTAQVRERFDLKWPDRDRLDMARVVWSYRRDSDTLMVHIYGRGRPALSVPIDLGERDLFFLRVDPKTDEVVGFQIEDFLAHVIPRHPELVAALTFAELDGIAPAEVAKISQEFVPQPNTPN